METIITAATVLSMFMNLSNDVNAPYYYNADVENGQVKTLYVYNDNEGQLSARLSYHYTYDEEGRLKSKVAYRHDGLDGQEKPSFRLDYAYNAEGYSVERSAWITPTTRRATAWSAASGTPARSVSTPPTAEWNT